MTTTGVYQGMGDGTKNSSRVLKPPGGGSADIFGTNSAAHTTPAAQEQKQNAQKATAGSNIFGGVQEQPEDQTGVKHINRKQQPSSQEAIFGDSPGSAFKKRNQEEHASLNKHHATKSKSEEFPSYDRSVYIAQMTPQRRNIQQVSTFNPITNESYAGFENQDSQQSSPVKRRGQNINEVSSYNVITNQTFDEEPSQPFQNKPGKRTMTSQHEGTYNPITGQTIGSAQSDEQQRNTSRVLNPPGGKSSGLW